MKAVVTTLILLYCLLSSPVLLLAQEENATSYQGKKYLDINIRNLDSYNTHVKKQQTKLLNKLKRKEKKYAARLKRSDSASYARYEQQPVSYDSISKLSKAEPTTNKDVTNSKNVDSLKKVQAFLQDKAKLAGGTMTDLSGYTSKLDEANKQTAYREHINNLIEQRTNGLKTINAQDKANVGGFKTIEKNTFYGKEKIKVFKQISEEPSKAEDKALEYLQGQKGFDQYLKNTKGMAGLSENTSTGDMEKMGYQTKRQINDQLQKKYGKGLPDVKANMGSQVKQFQDKAAQLKTSLNEVRQTKNSVTQIKHTDKPSFKVNPMRGLPFFKRIEKQYNWQTTRATLDGQPAKLQLSAMAGFKHTPKLSYGIGITTSLGLGQNWNNVHFSFEGIGFRSYTNWLWQYGISAYGGYERMYKQAVFTDTKDVLPQIPENTHNTNKYNESIVVGITKKYRVNNTWDGNIQVLYDLWWKEKGLRSPIVLRFATMKK